MITEASVFDVVKGLHLCPGMTIIEVEDLYKSKKLILLPILLRSMLFVMLEKKSKTCNKKMLINLS